MRIDSLQNPRIKQLVALQEKSRLRRETGLFVVEGCRELERCLAAGYEVESVFVCPDIAGDGVIPLQNYALRAIPPISSRSSFENQFSTKPCQIWAPPVHEVTGDHGSAGERTVAPLSPGGTASSVNPVATEAAPFLSSRGGPRPTKGSPLYEVSRAVYDKIAYRGGTEGLIATVRCRERRLEDLTLPPHPLIVVLEAVEKPGNLGAILRSADAARADAVLVCDPLTDLYNPNLIRASLGACFTVPTVAVPSAEAIAWLRAHGIRILTAQLQDSVPYYDTDMRGGTALVMGTEATGLTEPWRAAADAHIRIPMLGTVDSLNVSVSTAILLFEAVRQRRG